jgi:hypothetical protein
MFARRLPSKATRQFTQDQRGNVAIISALAAVPLLGLVGAAVDYSNAARIKSDLQAALDGAALAGIPHLKENDTELKKIVGRYLDANLPPEYRDNDFTVMTTENGTALQIRMQVESPLRIFRVMGRKAATVGAFSEARSSNDFAEVVLALDSTGTMRPHIPALRQASKDLIKILYDKAGSTNTVRVGLVPYVTAVNVGSHPSRMSWMDINGNAKHHGENFENVKIYDRRCDPPPPPPPPVVAQPKPQPQPTPPAPPAPPTPQPPTPKPPAPKPPGPPKSPDLGFADELMPTSQMAEVGKAVTAAAEAGVEILLQALGTTPAHAKRFWPYGDVNGPQNCSKQLTTPIKVNHFDLFDALDVPWKGCVEARPYPYDVSDEAPAQDKADTLLVPYFWPDESDSDGQNVRNNYLPDNPTMPGWVKNRSDGALREAWVWKYNKGPKPSIDDTSFLTRGPNAACPNPIVPLTSNRSRLTGALDDLRAYAASGTNIAEGLAWAWRVISPGEPFAEGMPYAPRNKKYIVLLTDGFNEVVPQGVSWNKSDYSSVGYAAKGRLGTTDRAAMTKELDRRLPQVCANVKDKGIQVFTVLYDPVGNVASSQVEALLRSCATSPDTHAFKASSQSDLAKAFQRIGGEISALRISQ